MIASGSNVAILGLGISGRAAVRYALARGASVRVSDTRPQLRFEKEEGVFLAETGIDWEADGHTFDFLSDAEIIVLSPGVDLALPVLKRLATEGKQIVGELALAAPEIRVPVVAVTGTNGKTTVTTLIGELLKNAGRRVFVGGNIGTPLFEYLLAPDNYDIIVVEVSSFQLESAGNFSPDVGILLNLTPDHLDRHGSLLQYGRIKRNLFIHQDHNDLAIINGDDELCCQLCQALPGEVQTFGSSRNSTASIVKDAVIVNAGEIAPVFPLVGTAFANAVGLKNAAAAILAVRRLGLTFEQIQSGLKSFQMLPHRIEFVAEVGGVRYYNDSKATNTGAVLAALEQFAGNVWLIAGGRDKGDDYRLLRSAVEKKVKKLIVIGEAAGLLQQALGDIVVIVFANSMEEAVTIAATEAIAGDTVLLSPACASFDMFTSYGHRGNEFKKQVLAVKAAAKKMST